MVITLPPIGAKPIPMPHFPTVHQAFIFRAYEYLPVKKIASLLKTTEQTVLDAAIGFEAANHYYFSKGQLREKILNCHDIISRLEA